MVDFGLLDFCQFRVLLQRDSKVVDGLLITAVHSIRLPQVKMCGDQAVLRLAMHEHHDLSYSLDVHSYFQCLFNCQWITVYFLLKLLKLNVEIIRYMLQNVISFQLLLLHQLYLVENYSLQLSYEQLMVACERRSFFMFGWSLRRESLLTHQKFVVWLLVICLALNLFLLSVKLFWILINLSITFLF